MMLHHQVETIQMSVPHLKNIRFLLMGSITMQKMA